MQKHFGYWAELLKAKTAVVYGPVNDPKGTWGVAIVRVADEAAAWALAADDPVIQAGVGFRYEVSAMPQLLLGT
ncbi:YciI family protein [Bradyrhizobium sp. ORS 111]|uniref:YciI family protein n=1 Tax=Bradyrhizobium sp. ORS 111 TaxID=1685958 RepID=UPI003890B764